MSRVLDNETKSTAALGKGDGPDVELHNCRECNGFKYADGHHLFSRAGSRQISGISGQRSLYVQWGL